MNLYKLSWVQRNRKWLACALLLLGTGAAAIGLFAWKRCADPAATNHSVGIPKNHPAAAAVPKKEPPQLLSRYSLAVNALTFSPDGLRMVTAASGLRVRGEIRVWDLIGGREERGCRDFPDSIPSLTFLPDGKTLVSGGQGYLERSGDDSSGTGELKLWDLDNADKPVLWRQTDQPIVAMTLSPQGDRLAVGCDDGRLTLYNRATKQPERILRGKSELNPYSNVAFSADGKKIAWGGVASSGGPPPDDLQGIVQVWDALNGKLSNTLHPPNSPPIDIPNLTSVAFLPGGDKLVSSCGETIFIWDVNSGQIEATLKGHQAIIHALALSPDGRLLASADSDGCIKLWQVATRREKTTLRPLTIVVQGASQPGQKEGTTVALAFDPDGEILASSTVFSTESGRQGVVELWDLVSLREVVLPH